MILYEPLVRVSGLMKLNVIIITKLAQYGIKNYVVTDVEASWVLKYIVYTGKDIVYSSKTSPEDKTTIKVVKPLYETIAGTYKPIYIYRLYVRI